ncbi:hypothetical protein F511_07253 [Dorcoceras hygrometricum]|uniref:Uncharacterized protein n=1 Tax=Dorcoceras hygrometricum TaxID=472368 RepID=A0A2Z7B119_9LAMI|nr:hypothetical protein F511_07253 [Dorcoceras hygrometricum]
MDYEMDDCIDDFYLDASGIDDEYEFDASRFFDFTRVEFDSEIEEAERWFEVSGDYPNSPFIVKLNLEKLLSVEAVYDNASAKGSSNSDIDSTQGVPPSKKDSKGKSKVLHDTPKAKQKSSAELFQTRDSTLMKPTASHLAKQNKMQDLNSSCSCTRLKNSVIKVDERQSGFDNLATKRQKLEIGYLRKILRTSSLPKPVKSQPQVPQFQVFNLRTMQRASQHSTKVFPIAADVDPVQDVNQEATTLMEPKFSTSDKLLEIPPTEQFNKRCHGKSNPCGDSMKVHETSGWSNLTSILFDYTKTTLRYRELGDPLRDPTPTRSS